MEALNASIAAAGGSGTKATKKKPAAKKAATRRDAPAKKSPAKKAPAKAPTRTKTVARRKAS
jgi:DNA topoisomerase-1